VFEDVMAKAGACGETRLRGFAGCHCSRVIADLGDRARAEEMAREMFGALAPLGQPHLMMEAHFALAWIDAADRNWARAVERLEAAAAPLEGSDNGLHGLLIGSFRSECLLEAGRADEAEQRAIHTLESARLSKAPWVEGKALRALGRIAAARGRSDEAARHYDESIAILDRTNTRLELARTLVHRGGLRGRSGDAAGADADRSRARELMVACSARRDLEDFERGPGSPRRD
jgi:tetratricopeptide (TPR) repeat protein